MPADDVSSFLFGGGGRAAKFDQVGDQVTGTIVDAQMQQQTAMETNEPLTWSDGRPRMQLVITLQTDDRNGDDDDGQRRIYCKGGNYEVASGTGTSLKDAISDALKKANARSLDEGGKLTVAYTGEAKRTNRGFNPAKLYRAKYEAPKVSIKADDLFEE